MNDATAQMGVQFGQHMAAVGGEYVQKNFNALLPMPVLKHYFNVSNSYVLHKLRIVLFLGGTNRGRERIVTPPAEAEAMFPAPTRKLHLR